MHETGSTQSKAERSENLALDLLSCWRTVHAVTTSGAIPVGPVQVLKVSATVGKFLLTTVRYHPYAIQ